QKIKPINFAFRGNFYTERKSPCHGRVFIKQRFHFIDNIVQNLSCFLFTKTTFDDRAWIRKPTMDNDSSFKWILNSAHRSYTMRNSWVENKKLIKVSWNSCSEFLHFNSIHLFVMIPVI